MLDTPLKPPAISSPMHVAISSPGQKQTRLPRRGGRAKGGGCTRKDRALLWLYHGSSGRKYLLRQSVSVCLSVYLSVRPSFSLCTSMPLFVNPFPPFCLSICMSVCIPLCLSLLVRLCVCFPRRHQFLAFRMKPILLFFLLSFCGKKRKGIGHRRGREQGERRDRQS